MFKPRKGSWENYGRKGLRLGEGNYPKYLKRGWNRKEGRENEDYKKGEQAGSRGGCLKKEGADTPL